MAVPRAVQLSSPSVQPAHLVGKGSLKASPVVILDGVNKVAAT